MAADSMTVLVPRRQSGPCSFLGVVLRAVFRLLVLSGRRSLFTESYKDGLEWTAFPDSRRRWFNVNCDESLQLPSITLHDLHRHGVVDAVDTTRLLISDTPPGQSGTIQLPTYNDRNKKASASAMLNEKKWEARSSRMGLPRRCRQAWREGERGGSWWIRGCNSNSTTATMTVHDHCDQGIREWERRL